MLSKNDSRPKSLTKNQLAIAFYLLTFKWRRGGSLVAQFGSPVFESGSMWQLLSVLSWIDMHLERDPTAGWTLGAAEVKKKTQKPYKYREFFY
jgi:hypothetical protein